MISLKKNRGSKLESKSMSTLKCATVVVALLTAAGVSGCAASYYSRPEVLHEQSTEWLCSNYPGERAAILAGGPAIAAGIRAELDRRGAMSPTDWALVDSDKLTYGMSKCALEAIYGPPSVHSYGQSVHGEVEVLDPQQRPYTEYLCNTSKSAKSPLKSWAAATTQENTNLIIA
jgi:hypothetical protein